jgi:hypothetical protein
MFRGGSGGAIAMPGLALDRDGPGIDRGFAKLRAARLG